VEVFGFHHHVEGLPDEKALRFEVDALGEAIEAERHEDLDAALLNTLVFRGVLAFEVGIDRYLRAAASTNGRDVVDCHTPATVADEFECLFAEGDLHGQPPHFLVGSRQNAYNPHVSVRPQGLRVPD
jgi:hypothetical protein